MGETGCVRRAAIVLEVGLRVVERPSRVILIPCSDGARRIARRCDRRGAAGTLTFIMSEPAPTLQRPRLDTSRVIMRLLDDADAEQVVDYYRRNRVHLEPTSPARADSYYTVEHWQKQIAASAADFDAGRAIRLYLFQRPGDDRVVGSISFSEIVRGPLQACYLGYALDAAEQGRGLMTESLRVAIDYAFREFNLHRVMAGYIPTNERSGAVLRRLGFVVEGFARDYLLIRGHWHDHVLTGLVNPAWKPPPGS